MLGSLFTKIKKGLAKTRDAFTGVVDLWTENESPALCRRLDRPTRKRTRDVDHILLRISTVDSKRVQLEQFTPIVLVEPRTLLLLLLLWPLP